TSGPTYRVFRATDDGHQLHRCPGGRRTMITSRPVMIAISAALLLSATAAWAAEVGRGEGFAPIEIDFRGPVQSAPEAPARDITFQVTFRQESGRHEYTVHGFWDGDGRGGTAGSVFKARFCPTAPGRWGLVKVQSRAPALRGQRQGDHVTATPSRLH